MLRYWPNYMVNYHQKVLKKWMFLKRAICMTNHNEITFENYEKRFNAIFNKYIKEILILKLNHDIWNKRSNRFHMLEIPVS